MAKFIIEDNLDTLFHCYMCGHLVPPDQDKVKVHAGCLIVGYNSGRFKNVAEWTKLSLENGQRVAQMYRNLTGPIKIY